MSNEVEFLSDFLSRPWSPDGKSGLQPVGLFIGKGTNALEVAVAQTSQGTARSVLVDIWKARKGRRAAPLLLIVLHSGGASITGATGEVPPVYTDMDIGQVERLCREALASYLIEQILEIGLEPTEPPPLLPPINQDEIELLCWMGIEPEDEI